MSEFKEVKDDGGPAFPRAEVKDTAMGFQVITGWCPGMSLRDYFIAHAPAEPPKWFRPVMTTDRPQEDFSGFPEGASGVKKARECITNLVFPSSIERRAVLGYCERELFVPRNKADIKAWEEEYEKQRLIQWPSAWADTMLEARKK